MDEKPRRPILSLKGAAAPPRPAAATRPQLWKCKPCGKTFEAPADAAADEPVRCPACNARLGLAREFRTADPLQAKVRARPVARHEPAPAKPTIPEIAPRRRFSSERPAPQVISVVRRTRKPD